MLPCRWDERFPHASSITGSMPTVAILKVVFAPTTEIKKKTTRNFGWIFPSGHFTGGYNSWISGDRKKKRTWSPSSYFVNTSKERNNHLLSDTLVSFIQFTESVNQLVDHSALSLLDRSPICNFANLPADSQADPFSSAFHTARECKIQWQSVKCSHREVCSFFFLFPISKVSE